MIRRLLFPAAAVLVLAGCGGSSTNGGLPTIQAAKQYTLVHFAPTAPATAGKPVRVSFVVQQPDGTPLTKYKHGPGPHTGVHLIIVRRDLATIVHVHPPVAPNGTVATTVTLSKPGPYRVVVDVYPQTSGPQSNFQLFTTLHVAGKYVPQPLPPFSPTDVVDGYRVTMHGKPNLHAVSDDYLHLTVTAPDGKPAPFTPWFGAMAHAIFFERGTLVYFHTHVCAPGQSACSAAVGARISGTSTAPGQIKVGVLVPVPGTWRLFLQFKVDGHVLTAPFTLDVKP
ncbi:MAG TPA: hypothetical protein VFA97_05640 [Gaiellaceae bacterium]|nr:hypothetical protein [Gaiellaceae bacterium]